VYRHSNGGERHDDLLLLKRPESRREAEAVIDRSIPQEQAVEAHRYVHGRAQEGNVVLSVAPAPGAVRA
jgi:hypothetical protein